MSMVRLTLIKSPIGYKQDQKDTVQALGLFRMGYAVEREDSRSLRGMALKVQHLVRLEELQSAARKVASSAKPRSASVTPRRKAT